MSNLLGKRSDTPETLSDGGLTNTLRVNEHGELMAALSGAITVSGGATEAKQDDEISILETIRDAKLPDAIDAGGGQLVIPVGVVTGSVSASQDGPWTTTVSNLTSDPALGFNQLTEISKLDSIKTATESISARIPVALSGGAFVTTDANIALVSTATQSIDGKTPALDVGRTPTFEKVVNTTPVYGNGTCPASPTTLQLSTLSVASSPNGWYLTNESSSISLRIADSSVSATVGHLLGSGQTTFIPSASLSGHYVSAISGTAAISVRGTT